MSIVLSTAQFKYLYRTTSTISRVNLKWTANLLHLNTLFTPTPSPTKKKKKEKKKINTGRNFRRTLSQQFCLSGASNKLNILSLNFQLIEVPVEVHKSIKFTTNNTVLLLQVKVFVRLLSIEQIIKNANSMCISCSVKHPQTI